MNPIPPNAHDYNQPRADKTPRPIPGSANGEKWHLVWRSKSDKTGGKSLPLLIGDAQTGAVSDESDTPTLELGDVKAKVYQNGRHAADIQAAHIQANEREKIVHGSGGVTVIAQSRKPGDKMVTTITADNMRWNTNKSVIAAFGKAHVERRGRPDQPILTQDGGNIVYDMKQDTFKVGVQPEAPADAP